MRIAPLAFGKGEIDKVAIESISRITHHHDEAYAGALAVTVAIQSIIKGSWTGKENLLTLVAENLPDTKVRDRLLELAKIQEYATIREVGLLYGNGGYVVESVPLSIFAAGKVPQIGFKEMLTELVETGGDTDSNCSMAGQISGAFIGVDAIPAYMKMQLMNLRENEWIKETIAQFIASQGWHN